MLVASPESPWRRYGLAILFVTAAVMLRNQVHASIGDTSVSIFLAAILASAWFGGVGPAIVSLLALHFVHGSIYEGPEKLLAPTITSLIGTGGYYVVGITVGVLSDMHRAARNRAQQDQREAVTQREHLRATLSCMADGVIVTDNNGQVTLMNRAAESLTAWNVNDAKARPCWEVFAIRREDAQEATEYPIARVLKDSRVVHCEEPVLLVSRKGATIPVAYSAAPVHAADGSTTGVVLIFRDESQRRRAELALRNADKRKDEFLATLAHELRNPLAPICMGAELLALGDNDAQTTEEVREMISRQAHHMVRLIDDLLDVSRITRGKLDLSKSRIELADVVGDAVAAVRPALDANRHDFVIRMPGEPMPLLADGHRLTQVVTNLLNNAAKFTPPEGRIELVASQSGGEVSIAVSDSGIGIAADKIDSVFEMFAQIHPTGESARGGLGIGLALVKSLVELHGGRVEVHSRGPNLGTTFNVRLPMLCDPPASNNEKGGNRAAYPRHQRKRVLIVDDNPDALESLSLAVEWMGNEVRRAHDGVEALQVAETFKPDIVLMDIGMPNMDGIDAARQIRQEPWGRDLALVATTGWGQDEDRRRTAEAGFDRHLVKPVAISALRELLSETQLRRTVAEVAKTSDG
jgi:PAS domain S-box-containing protein